VPDSTHLLYEMSPKLWLREPNRLAKPAAKGLQLTREDLIAGLMAYALSAAALSEGIGAETLKRIDVRIAHPVWPSEVKDEANDALERICARARNMALGRAEWGTPTVKAFQDFPSASSSRRTHAVDVLEPIAAAVELLPHESNITKICAVVDVGAGTTDIGLFQSLVPDEVSSVRSKLYGMGGPISVFKAGNQVDEIVLELLKTRAGRLTKTDLADLKARMRSIKETIFENGFIQEMGVDLKLEEVESDSRSKQMAREIRAELERVVQREVDTVKNWTKRASNADAELNLVMAGGGATMGFLRKELKKPIRLDGMLLNVKLEDPPARHGGNEILGASRSRMAVALGGASQDYDEVQHEKAQLHTIHRGSI